MLASVIDTIKYVKDQNLIKSLKSQIDKNNNTTEKQKEINNEISKINDRNKLLPVKYMKNFFDMPVALSAIEMININLGVKGFCGFISSFSSAYLLWPND